MTSKEELGKIKKLIFIMGEILVAESKQDIPPEEAIQRIRKTCNKYSVNRTDYETIKQDLDRLEKLEKAFDALSKDDEKAKKLLSLEIEKNRKLQIIEEKLEKENQELKGKVNYLNRFIEKYENIPGMATTLRLLHNTFKHMFDNDFKDMFVNCKLTPLPDVEELKMTSQKALQLIRNYHNAEAYETYHNSAKNIFKRELDLIEKDLEILQMLKKRMSIKTDYYDDDDMRHEYEYIAYNGMDLWIESKEEFNKLKEWLENDK